MKASTVNPSIGTSSRFPSPGSSRNARTKSFALGRARSIVFVLAFACGLFAVIAFLDAVAQPNDISPGTAFAATSSGLTPVDVVQGPEAWAADTTAQGTRPESIADGHSVAAVDAGAFVILQFLGRSQVACAGIGTRFQDVTRWRTVERPRPGDEDRFAPHVGRPTWQARGDEA